MATTAKAKKDPPISGLIVSRGVMWYSYTERGNFDETEKEKEKGKGKGGGGIGR